MKKMSLILLSTMMLASCSSLKHTADTESVANTITTFTVADLNVNPQKQSLTTSWSFNPFRQVSIDLMKENTEAALVNQAGADVLVEPQYIVEKRGFLRGGSVTVTGYPAKYENFHKMTKEEADIVKNLQKSEKKKTKRWILF